MTPNLTVIRSYRVSKGCSHKKMNKVQIKKNVLSYKVEGANELGKFFLNVYQ